MKQATREKYNAYKGQIAAANGVADVAEKFTATPTIEQSLEQAIQGSADFLKVVNHIGVDDQSGEKVGLSVTGSVAGRTDTTGADRVPVDVSGTDTHGYACKQTNYDTFLRYAQLDAWSKFPNFHDLLRKGILEQIARDRVTIGFNGSSAAATTDRATYPLLQDVNIGWLKKLQTEASARYQTGGANANSIRVGTDAGNDYKNLDALVLDMRSNLLASWYARNNEFVVVCGSDLVDDKIIPMVGTHAGTPTESLALDTIISNKRLGGLRVIEVPNFPSRALMITRLGENMGSNLSIYSQNGTHRRNILDNPKRDRIEDFQSINEAYVIEELAACCAAVNIDYWTGAAWL
jgi:P2 family phage major capsid protein